MKIKAISISDRKGIRKKNISKSRLIKNFGLENDAHGGKWHRQVSFLAEESIQFMRDKGLDVVAGNFAENITTEGFDLTGLEVGTHLHMGETEVIISQLGKICHNRCAIYHQAGDCVMPREGIFGIVVKEGEIVTGDQITILPGKSQSAALVVDNEITEEQVAELEKKIREQFQPAVFRLDTINRKNNNLAAILKDLTETQKTDWIIIFDPKRSHGLNQQLFGEKQENNTYKKETSIIHHCSSIKTIQER